MTSGNPSTSPRGSRAPAVNLLPPRRREARRQRLRARVWFGICVTCAIALAGMSGVWNAAWAGDGHDLSAEIAKTGVEIDDNVRAAAMLRAALGEERASLDVDQAISGQPDWSILLALLTKVRGDEIVLDRASVEASAEGPPPPVAAVNPALPARPARNREASLADPAKVVIRAGGYGRSQAAVSSFVLRLEELRLFDSVSLLKNTREPFLNGEAVAFRIECVINGGAGGVK